MQAMKCDRCRKFYDYYAGSKTFLRLQKQMGLCLLTGI